MKKLFLALLTLISCASTTTVFAQYFNVPAKHAIAFEATTGKILY